MDSMNPLQKEKQKEQQITQNSLMSTQTTESMEIHNNPLYEESENVHMNPLYRSASGEGELNPANTAPLEQQEKSSKKMSRKQRNTKGIIPKIPGFYACELCGGGADDRKACASAFPRRFLLSRPHFQRNKAPVRTP